MCTAQSIPVCDRRANHLERTPGAGGMYGRRVPSSAITCTLSNLPRLSPPGGGPSSALDGYCGGHVPGVRGGPGRGSAGLACASGEVTLVLRGSGPPSGRVGAAGVATERKHGGIIAPRPDRNGITTVPRRRRGALRHLAQWGVRSGLVPMRPLVLPGQPRGFRADPRHRCGRRSRRRHRRRHGVHSFGRLPRLFSFTTATPERLGVPRPPHRVGRWPLWAEQETPGHSVSPMRQRWST